MAMSCLISLWDISIKLAKLQSINLPEAAATASVQFSTLELEPRSMDAAKCQVLRARLAKKATFEAALRDLQACIAADPAAACDPAVEALVGRSFTLLRTRYSSRAFWRAGRELYAGAAQVCGGLLAVAVTA